MTTSNSRKRLKASTVTDMDIDLEVDEGKVRAEKAKKLENLTVEQMSKMYFPKLTVLEQRLTKCTDAPIVQNNAISELQDEVQHLKAKVNNLQAENAALHIRASENY